jgi:hypothetical protein
MYVGRAYILIFRHQNIGQNRIIPSPHTLQHFDPLCHPQQSW